MASGYLLIQRPIACLVVAFVIPAWNNNSDVHSDSVPLYNVTSAG